MAKQHRTGKLAVILHADIAGSTQLVHQDEQLAHQRIQESFRRLSSTVTRYHGHVHELRGDALLAVFERASGAVSAALAFQQEHTRDIDAWDEFTAFFTPENAAKPEIHGGFARSHWCGSPECEARINDELSVTIRCLPPGYDQDASGTCVVCGKDSPGRVVFAKSY